MAKQLVVELKLGDWSQQFLKAFSQLLSAVEHADHTLLEDKIRDAHEEVKRVLQEDGLTGRKPNARTR